MIALLFSQMTLDQESSAWLERASQGSSAFGAEALATQLQHESGERRNSPGYALISTIAEADEQELSVLTDVREIQQAFAKELEEVFNKS